jgi:hypothetical protein
VLQEKARPIVDIPTDKLADTLRQLAEQPSPVKEPAKQPEQPPAAPTQQPVTLNLDELSKPPTRDANGREPVTATPKQTLPYSRGNAPPNNIQSLILDHLR